MAAASGRVSFGAFELDLDTGELRKSGRILKLQPQPARVLCLLVSQAGNLVSREDLRRRLWGESTFVDYDVGVDYCVNRIRSVLCDKARAPRYVETLPRRGYRFIAPVERQKPFAEPTLAVLPFANLNGDSAREYFADGVTDALITELARIQVVRVISRQSIIHLKGSSRKLDEIARDLGVDGVVEGAVLHEGNRVRVTAQLILMEPERHAWAQSYDCDMSAILTTQRDAAGDCRMCGYGVEARRRRDAGRGSGAAGGAGNYRSLFDGPHRTGQDERGRDRESAPVLAGDHRQGAGFCARAGGARLVSWQPRLLGTRSHPGGVPKLQADGIGRSCHG